MTPEEYVLRLTENSDKKKRLLVNLLDLTKHQTEAISQEDTNRLNELIATKQSCLDGIDKLDDEFDVYFQRLKQTLRIASLDEIKDRNIKGVKELQSVISSIMGLIREINSIEKSNSGKVKKVLDSIEGEIKRMNQGKKTTIAYNPTPIGQPPSYFIDKKK